MHWCVERALVVQTMSKPIQLDKEIMELDVDEIEIQLCSLPQNRCIAVAVRSAMRALPLLVIRHTQPFSFWESENTNKYLLSILRSYSYSIEYALTKKLNSATENTYELTDEAYVTASSCGLMMQLMQFMRLIIQFMLVIWLVIITMTILKFVQMLLVQLMICGLFFIQLCQYCFTRNPT